MIFKMTFGIKCETVEIKKKGLHFSLWPKFSGLNVHLLMFFMNKTS